MSTESHFRDRLNRCRRDLTELHGRLNSIMDVSESWSDEQSERVKQIAEYQGVTKNTAYGWLSGKLTPKRVNLISLIEKALEGISENFSMARLLVWVEFGDIVPGLLSNSLSNSVNCGGLDFEVSDIRTAILTIFRRSRILGVPFIDELLITHEFDGLLEMILNNMHEQGPTKNPDLQLVDAVLKEKILRNLCDRFKLD